MASSVEYVIYAMPQETDWLTTAATAATALAAIASLFVAWWALRYTSKQIELTHQHNMLMVRPHLAGVKHFNAANHRFSFTIENPGLGPAIFAGVSCKVDGVPCPQEVEPVEWLLRKLIPDLNDRDARTDEIAEDCPHAVGAELNMFSFNSNEGHWREIMKQLHKRCDVGVFYKSAYGEKFVLAVAGVPDPKLLHRNAVNPAQAQ